MQQITLSQMLANEVKTNGLDEKLARLIETVAACGVEISSESPAEPSWGCSAWPAVKTFR